MVKKLYCLGRFVSSFLRPMQIPLHSAHTCFFLILSLFPMLLLLLGVLQYTDFGAKELLSLAEGFLPEALLPIAQMLIDASLGHSSGTVISVSVLATLWSASRGMYGLLSGLWAVQEKPRAHRYWKDRLISMLYTLFFLLAMVTILMLHVFGSAILDFLRMTTIPAVMAVMDMVDLRFFLLLFLQTALFSMVYAWLPGRSNRLSQCIPGALVASLGWMIYSKLFTLYVVHFTKFSNIFGSIYAMASGKLWLYFCTCLLFYGAALNRLLQEKNFKFL